uniref:hypothetical protein n=1 Tax=Campylobacter coli TaxID=195 RepID=UPI0019D6F4AA
ALKPYYLGFLLKLFRDSYMFFLKYPLHIEWLQSEENSYRKISLNIFGDFSPILSFMKQLENSDLHYQIHKFEIDNTTSLNLHLKLTLSFISLAKLK